MDSGQTRDILAEIVAKRLGDVAEAKQAVPESLLRARIAEKYPGPPLSLYDAITKADSMAVAAEFKRASPSKGALAPPEATAGSAAAAYTRGGAAVLSVLTEPHWFKGSLADMEEARTSSTAAAASPLHRPVILRKEFVVDAYQCLEARAYGADTLLLIVASLPTPAELLPLMEASRALGMEPLVEVNSVGELSVALQCGARCIGINNRNLRTFTVDLSTTTRVVAAAVAAWQSKGGEPPALLSLSGIRSAEDVTALAAECAAAGAAAAADSASSSISSSAVNGLAVMRGFLIGEALMRAGSPEALVAELVAAGNAALHAATAAASSAASTEAAVDAAAASSGRVSVKICGVKRTEDALCAAAAGASFVGIILVPGSPRCPGYPGCPAPAPAPASAPAAAAAAAAEGGAPTITAALRAYREQDASALLQQAARVPSSTGVEAQCVDVQRLSRAGAALRAAAVRARPLSVGVTMNLTRTQAAEVVAATGVDVLQLHGKEDAAAFVGFPVPIIKVMHIAADSTSNSTSTSTSDSTAGEVEAVAERIAAWSHVAAAILLDSAASGKSGGTGVPFDHVAIFSAVEAALAKRLPSLPQAADAPAVQQTLDVYVAGGLKPESVAAVVQKLRGRATSGIEAGAGGAGAGRGSSTGQARLHLRCVGVDVSSGTEDDGAPDAAKGIKNQDKVRAFCKGALEA